MHASHASGTQARGSSVVIGALGLLCLQLGATPGWAGPPAKVPPAEAFVYGSDFDSVALAPDGKTIALGRDTPQGHKIVMFEPGQTQPRRVLNVSPSDTVRSLWWADSSTLIADMDTTVRLTQNYTLVNDATSGNDPTRLYRIARSVAADLAGNKPRVLPDDNVLRSFAIAIGARRSKPGSIVVLTRDYSTVAAAVDYNTRLRDDRRESGFVSTLMEVDAKTGKGKVLEHGTQYTDSWLLDDDGLPIARGEWHAENEQYLALARSGHGWRTALELRGREYPALGGTTADGKSLVVLAENGGPYAKAWAIPFDGSTGPTVLYDSPTEDIDSVLTERRKAPVLGYRVGGLEPSVHWTDPKLASQQRTLDKAFPHRTVDIWERSSDGQRVLATVGSPSQPLRFYLVDFATGRADIVGDTYPGLDGYDLAEVRSIHYTARDGATIPAYLLVPPGAKAESLPLVVLPHGGPEARDGWHFDWLAQFLATRGYAVLQPQFRGSTGFGRAHRLAGYREWGGRMQDDVTDGVRHLVATGVADPSRICIVGGSYGGYAALAGAAFTPDLYACAVSINGVSDLPRMIGDLDRRGGEQSDAIQYWKSHIGPGTDPKVAARSPVRAAANVRAPVLLLHGEFDTVVPRTQSDAMAAALRAAGKPVELYLLSGEDHWLSSASTRLEVLQRTEAFLARYLSATPKPSATPAP